MSKRILSLALALVMVILAVPVMAFSALADGETLPEKNPTVNFRTGATYDEATLTTAHGEILQTKTWAELLADPSLLNPKVEEEAPIAWAWWDATAQKYITLADFFRGAAELPDAEVMDVYPIMPTTSYLDGLPIISATDDDENAETPAKLALEMYRSGWTFTTPYKPNMLLMTIEQGTKLNREWYRGYLQAWAGDRAPLYGAVLQNGDILLGHNTAGYKEYATGLTWQVPVSGKYYVTLPKADNVQILVIVNGICVLGAEDQIGQANPALNDAKDAETGIAPEDADWFTFGLATDEGYDALTDKTVVVSAKAGEKIDIIIKRNYPEDATPPKDVAARDDQWLKGWVPTIAAENPTFNFRAGAVYDESSLTTAHGEIVQTKTWLELLADPALQNPNVGEETPIVWAYWNAAAKKYTVLSDFVYGLAELPAASVIELYPIMASTTYTDGLPIISGTDDDNNAETPAKLKLEMYRGGWTFTTPYKTSGMLIGDVEQGTKDNREWYRGYIVAWPGDRAPLYGGVLQNGDILLGHNTAGYKEYATGLTFQVPVSGEYVVTLPKTENVQLIVAVNGICVVGAEAHIGQSNPALNSTKNEETGIAPEDEDWFTFGLATDEGYDALTDKVVKVSAKAGEKIDIIIKRNYPEDAVPPRDVPARDDQWLKGWAPTIALEKAYTVNLMQGPATSNGMNNAGTCVGTIPMDYLSAYADYALDGTNFGYAEGELLDWSAWSIERDCFILLSDCISGKEELPSTNFYPMLKDTTSVPYYNNWIEGENQVLWEFEGDPVKNESEGKLIGYTGGWSYGSYVENDYKTFTYVDYTSTWLLVRDDVKYQSSGASYIGSGGGHWSTEDTTVGVLRYEAPKSGKILVKIPHAYAAGLSTAVAKNGTIAWPAAVAGKAAGTPSAEDFANWYVVPADQGKVVDRTVRYAEENCVTFELNVAAGDKVEILFQSPTSTKTEWWYPGIEYTAIYEAPTGVAAVPSIGNTLAVDFEAMLPDGYDFEGGVLVNGEVADSISFAPYDADEEFTVQPFYVLDESTKIYGEEKTYTFNSLMALYEGTPYAKLAKAALNYTAAFEALFGTGDIPVVPSFTGTYNSTMGAVDYTGEGEVIISAASLIVNEKIGIKLVVRELPEGAKLQIASDKAFTTILNAGADTMTATSDNTGHKYIMDGISIANFNTMYYFRVVDADGAVISDTVQYSVSTYCARMADSTNLKLSSLVHAMMGLYEAGTAN